MENGSTGRQIQACRSAHLLDCQVKKGRGLSASSIPVHRGILSGIMIPDLCNIFSLFKNLNIER